MIDLAQISRNKIRCYIATFYLILMNQQYVPWEGDLVSPLKVTAMCVAPVIIIFAASNFSRAALWGLVYIAWLFASMYLRFDTPRLDTLGYSAMFICCYIMFYSLVYHEAFSLDYFHRLTKCLIWAYIIVLLMQQFVTVFFATDAPFINLMYYPPIFWIEVTKVPSLSLEPSHTARIMAALFVAFLKTKELQQGRTVTIGDLFSRHRYFFIGFLYAMISMCSGTAIFMLVVLSFYFLRSRQMILVFPLLLLFWGQGDQEIADYNSAKRLHDTMKAAFSGDADEVRSADHSGASRVNTVINAFKLDFYDSRTWLGYGTDVSISEDSDSSLMTIWTDRGVICYFIGWILVFFCAIRTPLSVMTLIFLFGCRGEVLNVYYIWGILMTFTCVSYFEKEKKTDQVEVQPNPELPVAQVQ